jgi:hypothetical protein
MSQRTLGLQVKPCAQAVRLSARPLMRDEEKFLFEISRWCRAAACIRAPAGERSVQPNTASIGVAARNLLKLVRGRHRLPALGHRDAVTNRRPEAPAPAAPAYLLRPLRLRVLMPLRRMLLRPINVLTPRRATPSDVVTDCGARRQIGRCVVVRALVVTDRQLRELGGV